MAVEARTVTGRNEPCPCGSGKKYKHCHLREDQARAARGEQPVDEDWEPPSKVVPAVIGGVGVAVAVGTGIGFGPETGFLFAVIGALVLGGYFLFRNPPPPRDDGGDPSGLNFGR
jgi:hypothetical protein